MSADWFWKTFRRRLGLVGLGLIFLISAVSVWWNAPQTFSVILKNALAGLDCRRPGMESGFWIVRDTITQASKNTELVPVNAALFLAITNLQGKPITIRKLEVEAKNITGNWQKLGLVLSTAGRVYFSGTGEIKSLTRAIRITEPFIDRELRNVIGSGLEIRGWVFLQYPESFVAPTGQKKQFRVRLFDAGDINTIVSVVEVTPDDESDLLPGSQIKLGAIDDFIYPLQLPLVASWSLSCR